MKIYTGIFKYLLIIALMGINSLMHAQHREIKSTKPPVMIEEGTEDYSPKLPPLDTLISIALRNSPMLKMQESMIQKNAYLIKNERAQWTDGISTDITGGFGNQSLLVQQPTGEITNFNNFNNGYRAGATLRVSIYDLFGRKNQVGMAINEYEASRHKKEVLAREINAEVTSLYFILIASQNILKIKSEAKYATSLNRAMAEKEFNEANIPVAELSRIIEISSKAATEYEIAKQEMYKNLRIMENMVGIKLF